MWSRAVAALALGFALGCSGNFSMPAPVPPPADRQDHIGVWQGGTVDLTITGDGFVHYENNDLSSQSSLDLPIIAWHDQGFDAGLPSLSTTFVIDEKPHQADDGSIKMKVGGVEVTRIGDAPSSTGGMGGEGAVEL